MTSVLTRDVVNSGAEDYARYGAMLPETKRALDHFYRPFVLKFSRVLRDHRFLWDDVYT